MPRVVFEDQGLTGDIGDLVSNVAGGLLQGYGGQILTENERKRSQQEQAFGNPYQRVRRAALWNSMPEDVRGAPNAALYQELIAGGADPRTVLDTHRELSSDPAYGDAKTKASREAALKAAIGAGYVDANDQAGAEAFRRGETTIGQQWTRKKAQTEKDAEEKRQRDEKLADEKRRRDQGLSDDKTKRDELKARAGQVAKELGVGQPTPPAAVPTWGGGMVPTGTMPIPGTPGTEFSDPQDVMHVAGERRLRQTAEVNAADKTADNQLQAREGGCQRPARAGVHRAPAAEGRPADGAGDRPGRRAHAAEQPVDQPDEGQGGRQAGGAVQDQAPRPEAPDGERGRLGAPRRDQLPRGPGPAAAEGPGHKGAGKRHGADQPGQAAAAAVRADLRTARLEPPAPPHPPRPRRSPSTPRAPCRCRTTSWPHSSPADETPP
jgi:hypothetical protein